MPIDMSLLTEWLGWCSVVSCSVLLITTIMLVGLQGWILGVHSRMLGMEREDLKKAYMAYLANFKIAVLMLNLAPWLALKIMGF